MKKKQQILATHVSTFIHITLLEHAVIVHEDIVQRNVDIYNHQLT